MNATYEEDLLEAQNELSRARIAKQQREAAQRAPDAAISQAQARIDGIKQRAKMDAINAIRAQNDQVVEDVLALHIQTVAALERGDVRAALVLKDKADAAWHEHDRLRQNLLNEAGVYAAGRYSYRAAKDNRIRQVYGVGYKLLEWISQAPDATERQIRQGLAFAIMGPDFFQVINPSAHFSAAAAYERDNTPSY